jgi:hypothetical protein
MCLVPKPELNYHRSKHRLQEREVNNCIGFETIDYIRILFLDSSPLTQMVALWLTDTFNPFDFSNIEDYPHNFPYSLDKFLAFHGDNSIGARDVGLLYYLQ